MEHKSIMNLIKKLNLTVANNGYHDDRAKYFVSTSNYVLSWVDQEGHAVCVRIRHVLDHDDLRSDYFAGFFPRTLKQIKHYLTK